MTEAAVAEKPDVTLIFYRSDCRGRKKRTNEEERSVWSCIARLAEHGTASAWLVAVRVGAGAALPVEPPMLKRKKKKKKCTCMAR